MKISVRTDAHGFECAITIDGVDVLQLVPGSRRNRRMAARVAAAMRSLHKSELRRIYEEAVEEGEQQ